MLDQPRILKDNFLFLLSFGKNISFFFPSLFSPPPENLQLGAVEVKRLCEIPEF